MKVFIVYTQFIEDPPVIHAICTTEIIAKEVVKLLMEEKPSERPTIVDMEVNALYENMVLD